jgi:hypothetical protein
MPGLVKLSTIIRDSYDLVRRTALIATMGTRFVPLVPRPKTPTACCPFRTVALAFRSFLESSVIPYIRIIWVRFGLAHPVPFTSTIQPRSGLRLLQSHQINFRA